MKKYPVMILITLFFLPACISQLAEETPIESQSATPISIEDLDIVTGQVIFVPAYSEIFYDKNSTLDLTITLTIHNTDLKHPIIIKSVRYYDTNGNLVHKYIDQPLQLAPIATTSIVIASDDQRGGVGANFIVEWVAETGVYEPIVEAIMINTSGQQGISLLSPGRVISQTP
jgi:hypothetical protein